MRTTNTNKYPQGYAPKIEYWESKVYSAKNFEQMTYASNKLSYFKEKQRELDAKNQTISEDVKIRIEKRFGYVVLDFTDIQNIIK